MTGAHLLKMILCDNSRWSVGMTLPLHTCVTKFLNVSMLHICSKYNPEIVLTTYIVLSQQKGNFQNQKVCRILTQAFLSNSPVFDNTSPKCMMPHCVWTEHHPWARVLLIVKGPCQNLNACFRNLIPFISMSIFSSWPQ